MASRDEAPQPPADLQGACEPPAVAESSPTEEKDDVTAMTSPARAVAVPAEAEETALAETADQEPQAEAQESAAEGKGDAATTNVDAGSEAVSLQPEAVSLQPEDAPVDDTVEAAEAVEEAETVGEGETVETAEAVNSVDTMDTTDNQVAAEIEEAVAVVDLVQPGDHAEVEPAALPSPKALTTEQTKAVGLHHETVSEQLTMKQREAAGEGKSTTEATPIKLPRSYPTRHVDLIIMRAIAEVKPNHAEFGYIKRRWQEVADRVNEQLEYEEVSPIRCQRRYKQLTTRFDPTRKCTFVDPVSQELFNLTAAAVEDMKMRRPNVNSACDLRTAFDLMAGNNPPTSYEEFCASLLMASRGIGPGSTDAPFTPKRAGEGLAEPTTPLKRRRIEVEGVGEEEFRELERVMHTVDAKLQVLEDGQRGLEDIRAAQALCEDDHDAIRENIALVKTHILEVTISKEELGDLRGSMDELRIQLESLTKRNGEHEQLLITREQSWRMELEQLRMSLEEERERGRQLEKSIGDLRQETKARDDDRMAILDMKTALVEKTVADFEAVVQKQQELMALYKASLVFSGPHALEAPKDLANRSLQTPTGPSLETTKELARLRATIDTERSERMRGQSQLLDLLHQIFAKENDKQT